MGAPWCNTERPWYAPDEMRARYAAASPQKRAEVDYMRSMAGPLMSVLERAVPCREIEIAKTAVNAALLWAELAIIGVEKEAA